MAEYDDAKRKRLEVNFGHAAAGVVFTDIETAYIDESVKIGAGTKIGPNVELVGETVIGRDCKILQGTRIENSTVGDETKVDHSVVLDSKIGNNTAVGPFAYLRPNSIIGDDVKVGDFVEIKNSNISHGTKISHLTYVGDSDLGENINVGCGVVFVNYDGKDKHRSTVGDGSFIGCNTNIISPVTLEAGVYVAAGSTVTGDVPSGSLYVARAKPKLINGWVNKRGLLVNRIKKENKE